MKLHEFQAKSLLERHGLRVPRCEIIGSSADLPAALDRVSVPAMLKAQLRSGGRGKRGLVVEVADEAGALDACDRLLAVVAESEDVPRVLVEEKVELSQELFFALDVDDVRGLIRVLMSARGGIDVESAADAGDVEVRFLAPSADDAEVLGVLREAWGTMLAPGDVEPVAAAGLGLLAAMRSLDAEIVEVNPLALCPDGPVVLDAKVTIDDNALFRQPELTPSAGSEAADEDPGAELASRAQAAGLTYLELDGDIALMSVGAGYTMAVMDLLTECGGRPANFVDMSGGVGADVIAELGDIVFCRARDCDARAVVITFVITATPLESLVSGIETAIGRHGDLPPLFATIQASAASTVTLSYADGVARLRDAGVTVSADVLETARLAVSAPQRSAA